MPLVRSLRLPAPTSGSQVTGAHASSAGAHAAHGARRPGRARTVARNASGVASQHPQPRVPHVEHALHRQRPHRRQPRSSSTVAERARSPAEHDRVELPRLSRPAQHPHRDLRRRLQRDPRLARAPPREPARARAARAVPAVDRLRVRPWSRSAASRGTRRPRGRRAAPAGRRRRARAPRARAGRPPAAGTAARTPRPRRRPRCSVTTELDAAVSTTPPCASAQRSSQRPSRSGGSS